MTPRSEVVSSAIFYANPLPVRDKTLGNRPAVVTADGARALRQKAEAAKPQEVSIISKTELDRIKAITKIQTKEEQEMQRTVMEEQKTMSLAASKARRQRITEHDFKRATDKASIKVQEVPKKDKVENMLTKALDKLDEDDDDVKGFNQLCLQAKVLDIRNKQLEENKQLERDWVQE